MLQAPVFLVDSTTQRDRKATLYGSYSTNSIVQVNIASLLMSVLGPRLALLGPPGSMNRAVESLHHYRKHTTLALNLGEHVHDDSSST